MYRFVFYIINPIFWILSKMPFWVLYRISDFVFLLVYYVIGYRKKVVLTNLQSFFPEKSETELKNIQFKFYRHFVDIFVEVIKSFSFSSEEFSQHFYIQNNELLKEFAKINKSVIIVGSHFGNWEWFLKLGVDSGLKPYVVYAKINNPVLSDKVLSNRQRFGLNLLLKSETVRTIAQNKDNNIPSVYGLLSDQSPQLRKAFYWTNFMGKRVPFLTGAEVLAKKYDHALVYMRVSKVKRGYYNLKYELITDTPRDFKDFELTEMFIKLTEDQIRENPEYYLWTHNRLKHVGKETVISTTSN